MDAELNVVIERIARKFGRVRSMPVDAEDVAQEMRLFWVENHERWERQGIELAGQIRRLAWRAGTYAAQQKHAASGSQGEYFVADVRGLMDVVFQIWSDPEKLASLTVKQFETWQCIFMVLDDIAPADKTIIERRYRDADRLNGAEKVRLHRALERVTDMLNAYGRQGRVDPWDITGIRDNEVVYD